MDLEKIVREVVKEIVKEEMQKKETEPVINEQQAEVVADPAQPIV